MPLLLFFIFILLPLAELYVIIQVGQLIGLIPTLLLLLVDGFVGAALARSQGRIAWRRFNQAMASGRMPGREVADGAMIIFGGALLLSPGFLTDVLGIGLLLPPTRAILRGRLRRAASRTPTGRPVFFVYDRFRGGGGGSSGGAGRRPGGQGSPPPPPPPHAPSGGPGGSRGTRWDVEGTARELDSDEPELGPGSDSGSGSGEPR